MRWLRFATVVFFITFIQASSLINWISIGVYKIEPSLLLILLVYFALNSEPLDAVIASFSLGLAADLAANMLGPNIIAFGLCGSVLSGLRRVIVLKNMFGIVAGVFATAVCVGLVAAILGYFKGQEAFLTAIVRYMGSSVYTSLLAPYMFVGVAIISGWLGTRKFYSQRSGG
jgi:rod shape-determining protein MreD